MDIIKRSALMAIAFTAIWGVIFFVDRNVIGTNYANAVHDVGTGWFGWMLNWLTGEPRLVWYSPAATARFINGLVGYFIDIDLTDEPLNKWLRVGVFLQWSIVVGCAIWFSWIAKVLRIDWLDQIFLCLLFFCYPTLLVYTGHWGIYFEYWLLGLPLGLTLYAALHGQLNAARVGGVGCGFLVANNYTSLAVVLAFILVVVGQRLFSRVKQSSREEIIGTTLARNYLVAWLGLCAIAWSIGLYFSEINMFSIGKERLLIILLFGIVGWLFCTYVVLMIVRGNPVMSHFMLWVIAGFVVSSSVLLPWYWHGLFSASGKTIGVWQSVAELWYRIPDSPWYAVVWCFLLFLIGGTAWKIWVSLIKKTQLEQSVIQHTSFVILGMACIIVVAGATTGTTSGGPERGLFAIAPMFAVGCLVINRIMGQQWRILFILPMLALSAYSVFNFYVDYTKVVHEQRSEGEFLDEAIAEFLEQEPKGSVVCVGEEYYSKYCTVAYAYNRYRTKRSAIKLPTWSLFEGRVLSLNVQMPNELGNWDVGTSEIDDRFRVINGPLLIITKGGSFRDDLIEYFSTRNISIMPFWRWWVSYRTMRGEPVTNVSPGGIFIAGLDKKS